MKIKIFLCLGIVSSLLLVQCSANQNNAEYVAFDKAIDSLSNVVVKYNSEFDDKVKFSVLSDAVNAIDKAMLGYDGRAKAKLDQVRQLNSAAELAYTHCVGPVFEWCVAINTTLDAVLPSLTDEHTTQESMNVLWKITVDGLSLGLNETTTSLQLLEEVQRKVKLLRELLDVIREEINFDFGPRGKYGMRKEELRDMIDKSKRTREGQMIATLIQTIFLSVVSIVTGNIGLLMGLPALIGDVVMDTIKKEGEEASYEHQLEVIERFFVILEQKINHAREVALEVDDALKEDHKNLYTLSNLIAIASEKKEIPLINNPAERAQLVPKLSAMKQKCNDYVYWHGYGSEGYKRKEQRPKRETIESWRKTLVPHLKVPAVPLFMTHSSTDAVLRHLKYVI